MIEDDDYKPLSQLIHGYLHQDMDLEADTVPEAVAIYARDAGDAEKAALIETMARFESRHHNDIEAEFERRYWFDFVPNGPGESVPQFFAMVRAILADPESYRHFE